MSEVNVSDLMAWEQGELSDGETIRLFATLIRTGLAWTLQGTYGCSAANFISGGWITSDGEVTDKGWQVAGE